MRVDDKLDRAKSSQGLLEIVVEECSLIDYIKSRQRKTVVHALRHWEEMHGIIVD